MSALPRTLFVVVFLGLLPRPVAGQDAVSLFRQACDGGDMSGCVNLGLAYQSGQGVTQDLTRALTLFQRACDGGEMGGCGNVGLMHAAGLGVTQDMTRAVALFQQACDGGEAQSCNILGLMYLSGQGVSQDQGRAADLYQQACDTGDASGCTALADMYMAGAGVRQDAARALRLYQQAEGLRPTACDAQPSISAAVRPTILNAEDVEAATVRAHPPVLAASGIGGTVRVNFCVNIDGRVLARRIIQGSGNAALDDAALSVADLYRFSPARYEDRAVAVWITVPITFSQR